MYSTCTCLERIILAYGEAVLFVYTLTTIDLVPTTIKLAIQTIKQTLTAVDYR